MARIKVIDIAGDFSGACSHWKYAPSWVRDDNHFRQLWAERACRSQTPEMIFAGIVATRPRSQVDLLKKVELVLELQKDELPPKAGALLLAQSLQDDLKPDGCSAEQLPVSGLAEAIVTVRLGQ